MFHELKLIYLFLCFSSIFVKSQEVTNLTESISIDVNTTEDINTHVVNNTENVTLPTSTSRVECKNKNASEILKPIENSCNVTQNCVRKCCPQGKFLYRACKGCFPLEVGMEDWSPENKSNFVILTGRPAAKKCYIHGYSELDLFSNGTLFIKTTSTFATTDYYCIDNFIRKGQNETKLYAFACYDIIELSDFVNTMHGLTKISKWISCCFLLILIVLHIFTPEMRREMHGKCFLSMCSAILLGFLSALSIQLSIARKYNISVCITLAFLVQYFNLAFMFWLNLRCYETLRIIRGTVKAIPIAMLNNSRNRFAKFSLLCWGLPLIISAITLIMQLQPDDGILSNYRPKIGGTRCWFPDIMWIRIAYYYIFEIVLSILNVCYMSICFILLWKTGEMKCTNKKIQEKNIRIYNKKSLNMFWQQFVIFTLFILMSSLYSLSLINEKASFWYYLDVFIALQGFYLFAIFLLSSKSRRKVVINSFTRTTNLLKNISTSLTDSVQSMHTFVSNSSNIKQPTTQVNLTVQKIKDDENTMEENLSEH